MPSKPLNVLDFFKEFPNDNTCLEHLLVTRFGEIQDCPKCLKASRFSRVASRPVYQCSCGHQISPMAGTPFERSSTPLQKWFYAMYLFTTSRHGVPAKELQRQLSVTYKCAWRMGHEIRKYMAKVDGDGPLSGHVELDEMYVGGKAEGVGYGNYRQKRTAVFGMVERGGKVMTRVVPDAKRKTLAPIIAENVSKDATISTDEHSSYRYMKGAGYNHGTVHHYSEQWVSGIHHTNTIEGFWSRVKNSIRGTHIHVSKKHLSKYLGEFEFRWNMRGVKAPQMFDRLLKAF